MALYELNSDELIDISQTTFAMAKIKERADLQRLLRIRIDAIVSDAMVIAEEFGNWDDSSRRIDLLAINKAANLVVIELKRTEDGGHMELQAIRYAAMLSSMTWEQAVEAYRTFLPTINQSAKDAEDRLLEFLDWEEPKEEEFATDIKIVLASADFSRELTTAVLWLNERGLDIYCVRMVPYTYQDQILLDVQQVIPLPEAEEYQIRVREKAQQERASRRDNTAQQTRNQQFWAGLLPKANAASDLHQPINPAKDPWLASSRYGIAFAYRILKDRGRVSLWIQRPSKEENKAIFDDLYSHREQIEAAYGRPLEWKRNDAYSVSRIIVDVEGGNIREESTWETIQANMVQAMGHFYQAFDPYVKKYREGAIPELIAADDSEEE